MKNTLHRIAPGVWFPMLVIVPAAIIFAASAAAEPNAQLQEHCGQYAAEVFAKDYGAGTDDGYSFDYQAHYSARLNKCFFLLMSTFNEKDNVIQSQYLSDIFDDQEYGTFSQSTQLGVFECNVRNTVCSSSSKDEWYNLVKPYLEE
jgi:hypothetical protein